MTRSKLLGEPSNELDQSATVTRQCRLETLATVFPQARQRAALVPPHQAGIADYIGCKDRCQPALLSCQWNFAASQLRIVEGLSRLGNDAANVVRPFRLLALLRSAGRLRAGLMLRAYRT